MNLQARIYAFTQLGKLLNKDFYKRYEKIVKHASIKNTWFTPENIKDALPRIRYFLVYFAYPQIFLAHTSKYLMSCSYPTHKAVEI